MPSHTETMKAVRCAIYTRKSTESPTGQEMTSLAGQRAVCAAYIKCQAHKGWVELSQNYDDEGFSGGNLERPALHRLLTDAREGRIDAIVFYKIDRLTRSLADFVRLMDAFQHFEISFVSVTQSFDTSDSMGRMVLNILLTFAQFEREMMGDRIRDKKNTMRRSGLYIGGMAPLGYLSKKGRLEIIPKEAELVRAAFDRFDDYPSVSSLLRALDDEGKGRLVSSFRFKTRRRNGLWYGGSAQKMFRNPIYAGYQYVEGELVKADHEAYISLERWQHFQTVLAMRTKKSGKVDPSIHLLAGLIFDETDRILAPRMRGTKRWPQRYYESVSRQLRKGQRVDRVRIRGEEIERVVTAALVAFLRDCEKLRTAVCRAYADPQLAYDMQRNGPLAAERILAAKGIELRKKFEGLVSRVEVAKSEVRIWISLRVLDAYLRWNGIGVFHSMPEISRSEEDLYLLRADANLGPHRVKLKLPFEHQPGEHLNIRLVDLLRKAANADVDFLADPARDLDRHAANYKLTPSKFSRLLRLNYLAPDIKSAILDGRQPPDLTERKLLYSPLPADWHQQRAILGFPSPRPDRTYQSVR
ncbi:recombinase family protein [Sphingomonas kaistensis]|uniref:Recombinase family protein n=1 Tax=Sphingomonas kaistensis TaxID=298708 RepID=A0ABZ2FX09_9SPHN